MNKGIILAGGKGTRLYPATHTISKQLLPVYNKPMIYYPLKTLVDMGIKDILVIVSDLLQYKLFQDQLKHLEGEGIKLQFRVQPEPGGIPEAFIIGEEFIGQDDITLILGDNVIITPFTLSANPNTIFTYKVKNPQAYGVAVVEDGKLKSIVEKPQEFISDTAVIGLYVFSNSAVEIAKSLQKSARNELEIVDVISKLSETEGVLVQELDGFWFDCGTHDDLLECANLVKAIEQRTNKKIGL
jgi:glucose-1-phosphate thymidylyltransferase